jgi:hypothetical protein
MAKRIRWSKAAAAALAVVGSAWLAPPAGAAVTASQITSPSSPHYSIRDGTTPAQVAVSGTAPGASDGDQVDLRCYYNGGAASQLLAEDVAVAGEAFSAPNVSLAPIEELLCTLRAVPANTMPGTLTSFTGPVMAAGWSALTEIGSGPNAGVVRDFELWAQQLTAGVL